MEIGYCCCLLSVINRSVISVKYDYNIMYNYINARYLPVNHCHIRVLSLNLQRVMNDDPRPKRSRKEI